MEGTLRELIEGARVELSYIYEKVNGDLLSPDLLKVSEKLDELINQHMRQSA